MRLYRLLFSFFIPFLLNNASYGETRSYSDSWQNSGNYDISWFNNNSSQYTIRTNKELAGFAYLVNNGYSTFSGKTVKLGNNINLSGKAWITIGTAGANYFRGVFDGQGYTISGISVEMQKDGQNQYGFWGYLQYSTIKDLTLRGVVNVRDPNKENSPYHFYVGGLAGSCTNTTIERCKVEMDVKCEKSIERQSTAYTSRVRLGGIVGAMSNSVLKYSSHIGDISVSEWQGVASNTPIFGGLVGSGGTIEYCENISSNIYCHLPKGNHSSSEMYVGGIAGSASEIRYCRSVVNNLEIVQQSTASIWLYIGGICGDKNSVINCYSQLTELNVNSVSIYTGCATFGGVCGGGEYYSAKSNFSNSDVRKTCSITLKNGYDGAISYSTSMMKTGSFLSELNLYSQIQLGKGVWTSDENGYPCISLAHYGPTTGIKEIHQDEIPLGIYNLSGQKLSSPQKGINIIDGKKVYIK